MIALEQQIALHLLKQLSNVPKLDGEGDNPVKHFVEIYMADPENVKVSEIKSYLGEVWSRASIEIKSPIVSQYNTDFYTVITSSVEAFPDAIHS